MRGIKRLCQDGPSRKRKLSILSPSKTSQRGVQHGSSAGKNQEGPQAHPSAKRRRRSAAKRLWSAFNKSGLPAYQHKSARSRRHVVQGRSKKLKEAWLKVIGERPDLPRLTQEGKKEREERKEKKDRKKKMAAYVRIQGLANIVSQCIPQITQPGGIPMEEG